MRIQQSQQQDMFRPSLALSDLWQADGQHERLRRASRQLLLLALYLGRLLQPGLSRSVSVQAMFASIERDLEVALRCIDRRRGRRRVEHTQQGVAEG